MATALTSEAFFRLLACLDSDRERAGEKYEDLRRTLIKFFEWRGAPFPEDHADGTFNRVAGKLDEGIEIRNIGAYCHQVARLICLEVRKGFDSKHDPLDTNSQKLPAANTEDTALEREVLLNCLDECLHRLPDGSRALIVEYYQDESGDRIKRRKVLAQALGLRREALANRAQRLREKLERCVTRCAAKTVAI